MTGLLVCLTALFGASWLGASTLVYGSVLLGRRLGVLATIKPRAQVRLMLAALAVPPLLAAVVVAVVVAPHEWFGMADHCLEHPGHLHLCFVHGAPVPHVGVVGFAAVAVLWTAVGLGSAVTKVLRARLSLRRVMAATERRGGLRVFPGEAPMAFTVGLVHPAVVVSEGVAAESDRWSAVLEHEHTHAAHRDPLARWVAELLSAFHVPVLGSRLVRGLREAQELAADQGAADALNSRIHVAETLVEWMRWNHDVQRAAGVGFDSDPFSVRVHRLLGSEPTRPGPSARGLLLTGAALVATLCVFAPALHHAVETALGLLLS